MRKFIWIMQVVLAFVFLMAGATKLLTPFDELVIQMAWVGDFSQLQIILIGIFELLGSIGLIVPAATGIKPRLTFYAAIGLILDMAGAIITHVSREEYSFVLVNILLLAIAAFVAYGRSKYFSTK